MTTFLFDGQGSSRQAIFADTADWQFYAGAAALGGITLGAPGYPGA